MTCTQLVFHCWKDECLLKLGHQCSKNVQLFLISAFSGRKDLAPTEENLKLPECTASTYATVTTSKKPQQT